MVEFGTENIPEGFYKDKSGLCMKKECTCGKHNQAVDECVDCNPKPVGLSGWICPVCGRGHSPFKTSCDCVPYPQIKIQGFNTSDVQIGGNK